MALALTTAAKAPKDPVVMTVDGTPVTLSEFEYLFHKNADQQVEQESVDQYLQRFIDYKLKVIQARHERQDTTASFKKDFKQYRTEIAIPLLRDTVVEQKILDDSYAHTLENVSVDHIMLKLDDRAVADSLRALLANGKADFFEVAKQYSIDPSLKQNGGRYGWISAGVYPYAFEEAAYDTPVGQISQVAKTPYGYHILRVNDRRPDAGEIRASHILILTNEGQDTVLAAARADSIYTALQNGADFAELARRVSECPSKAQGGDLEWFGRGRMVPEFEEVAFDLKLGEVSKPVRSRFGYHVIKKTDARRASKADAMNELRAAIARDERSVRPRLARAQTLMKEYNTHTDKKGLDALMASVKAVGYDSTRTLMRTSPQPLFYVGDSVISLGNFFDTKYPMVPGIPQATQVQEKLDERMATTTLVYENHRLEQKYPEFRLLSNEYRDGLMLFASMEQNVWNRPTADPEGLEAFFNAHRADYAFATPRWKGYIISANEDSIIAQVNDYLAKYQPNFDDAAVLLKAQFPRNIKIERVVLPQGENAIVDYVAFDGIKPELKGRWDHYTTYLGHLINAPENAADVRGKVTADWVAQLEDEWMQALRKRYEVKVDQKVLKKVK